MRPAFLRCLVLALAATVSHAAVAAEPVEIPTGDILVVRTSSAERWFISSHSGAKRNLLVITVSADGDVTMATQPLPDRVSDDPNDPPPPVDTLKDLVHRWATEVGDTPNRAKLAAAYQATTQLVDQGKVTTPEQLLALQSLANTTLLGAAVSKWSPFFQKLANHLDANPPADLAAYKAAWLAISAGLGGG